MERDCGDIIDRWSIAYLKAKRIGTEENKREFKAFDNEIIKLKEQYSFIDEFCHLLLMINKFIWLFEAGSKSSKETLPVPHYILAEENREVLAKLGIINTEIKNYNSLRVAIKNFINKYTKTGFEDIKIDHLSQE